MKNNYLKMLLLALAFCAAKSSEAQTCTASFSYSYMPNGQVNFWSTSIPQNTVSTMFYWNFGNGSVYTATGSPYATTTYTANGTYTVYLSFATLPTCSNVATAVITVTNASPQPCNVNASFNVSYGNNGTVYFSNTSTGVGSNTNYNWNFGDNASSNSMSPVHTYSTNGTYTVFLHVINNNNPNCSDSTSAVVTVTNVCALQAGFNYSVSGNTVNFYNTTTPTVATTYTWSFGNNQFSNAVNPTTTYSAGGVYPVYLQAISSNPYCISSFSQTIIIPVVNPCTLNAGFSYTQGNNGEVNFNNTSTGTSSNTGYSWNFGDSNSSTLANPSHTYASNGLYIITLTATDGTCTSNYSDTVNVNNANCIANAGFSVVPTSTPQYWNAIPSSPNNVSSAVWSWGDGSFSYNLYSSHQYSAAGTYDLCLSVTLTCGSSDTYCLPTNIYRSGEGVVYINVVDPATVGLTELDNAGITIFPNPARDIIKVSLNGTSHLSVSLYDITGSLVSTHKQKDFEDAVTIPTSSLPNGLYILKLSSGKEQYLKQVIIQH